MSDLYIYKAAFCWHKKAAHMLIGVENRHSNNEISGKKQEGSATGGIHVMGWKYRGTYSGTEIIRNVARNICFSGWKIVIATKKYQGKKKTHEGSATDGTHVMVWKYSYLIRRFPILTHNTYIALYLFIWTTITHSNKEISEKKKTRRERNGRNTCDGLKV